MRIATFNVENLFSRPIALSFEDWDDGKPILQDHGRFNLVVGKPVYSAQDKKELLAIMNRPIADVSRRSEADVRMRQRSR